MFNPSQLNQALQNPAYVALSDADAATALSTPTQTLIATPITVTSLAASSCWGFAKTATFIAALQAASAAGDQTAAQALTLLSLLNGPGLYATDPQTESLASVFLSLPNVGITQADINTALYITSYPCGGVVAASDVTAMRATIAAANAWDAARSLVQQQASTALQWLTNQQSSGAAVPPNAAILAQLSTQ